MADAPITLDDPTLIVTFEAGLAWQWCDTCQAVIEHTPRAPTCPLCETAWPRPESAGTLTITGIDRDVGTLTASDGEYIFTEGSDDG